MSVVAVFVVGDVLTPGCRDTVVVDVEERKMAHEAVWRRTVPVLLAGLEEHAVPGLEDLEWAAAPLRTADPFEDVDRLAVRMGVPGSACAGREMHSDGMRPGGARRRRDHV